MDLVRAWVAAVAAFLVANQAIAYLAENVTTADGFARTPGTIAWNAASGFFVSLVAVVFGAISPRGSQRDDPRQRPLAVLAIPAAAALYSVAYALLSGVILGALTSIVAGAGGTLV